MVMLFAGIDLEGRRRFIGDVARGAACGCLCTECGSPLVAKKGMDKEWHFAHESGQERPECLAGAINLLRRLAIEHLQRRHRLVLPQWRQRVAVMSSVREHATDVVWDVGPVKVVRWASSPGRRDPVVRLEAADVPVDLFVEVDDRVQGRSSSAAAVGDLVFWCPVPTAQHHLRTEELVDQYIAREGRFCWRHLPDTRGLVREAEERLGRLAAEDDRRVAESRRRADEDRRSCHVAARVAGADESWPARRAPAPKSEVPKAFDWAPGWKPGTSLVFYRLTDGSSWVFYQRLDGSDALAPWPLREDGWDEALPRSVGVPEDVGVYRITSRAGAMTFLGPRAGVVRNSSDPREFEGL